MKIVFPARLATPKVDAVELYKLHPTLLDAALQCLLFVSKFSDRQYLPVSIEGLHFLGELLGEIYVHARIITQNEKFINGEILIYNANADLIVWIEKVSAKKS